MTGRVTDSQTGQPVAAVQVFIVGSGIGALTQQNGRYLLLNVPPGTHTVTAERIGYSSVSQQVSVTAGQTVVLDFNLTEQALGLDEIIVTGTPGGTQRRAIGNVVTSVNTSALTETVPIASMQDLLGSRSTGVRFGMVSPSVGAGSSVQIRGTKTFNLSNDPLIYVDGVRVNNDSRAGPSRADDPREGGRMQARISVLEDLNPEEIESIEIIKGPAAATLYGTEASAGVIQIITKRGQEGAPQYNLSVRQGINFMMDPAGRMGRLWACREHDNPPCTEQVGGLFSYNMYDETTRLIREGYFDWPKETLFSNGHAQAYNLDIRGGTDRVRYFASANRTDETGFTWYNTNKANNLRANLNLLLSDNFSLDISSAYVGGSTRLADPIPERGGEWLQMIWGEGYCLPWISDDCPKTLGFERMTPEEVARVETTRTFHRFTGGATLNFNSGDWLNSRIILGLDQTWDENRVLYPLDPTSGLPSIQRGQVNESRPTTRYASFDWAATARYSVSPAWGTATAVGVQFHQRLYSDFSLVGRGLPSQLSRTVNHTEPARGLIGFQYVESKSLGLFVQEEVNWNQRVFLTGALRFDDNSAFGTEFDPVIYPKFSGTWVMSDEGFWPFEEAISSFRLRTAWGKAGRQPDAFASTNRYGVRPGVAGLGTLDPLGPGNPVVGPEVSSEIEFGFDATLLRDRVAVEYTYFRQKNEDALLEIGLPPSVGFGGAAQQNLGRLDSWGWELSLQNRVYDNPVFSFDLDLSAEHVDNEIKSLGDFPGGQHRSSELRVGLPFPNVSRPWGVEDAEYDPAGRYVDIWGKRLKAYCDVGVSLAPEGAPNPAQYGRVPGGELVPCQERGDYRLFLGPRFPTYTFRVSPVVTLFNNAIRIQALAEGQHGFMQVDGNASWMHRYGVSYQSRTHEDVVSAAGLLLRDEQWEQNFDAAFWKLREVGLQYNLPQSLASRIGADRASVSVTGRDLFILWRAQEEINGVRVQDPERTATSDQFGGSNIWLSPPMSSVSAMMRVSF